MYNNIKIEKYLIHTFSFEAVFGMFIYKVNLSSLN